MIVNFNIPDAIGKELNEYAIRHGFASVKQTVVAYLKDCIRHERLDKLSETQREVITDDVDIS